MKSIPDNSVDCIICDLPYGTTSCSWDNVIDMDDLWKQYNRVCKDNSPIILFGSQPFTSILVVSNIDAFREHLIWVKNKSSSGMLSDRRHLKVHEDIVIFCKDSNHTYNAVEWEVPEDFIIKRKTNEIFHETNNIINRSTSGRVRREDTGIRKPISVLPYKVPYSPKSCSKTKNGDYRVHPTQKPIALIEYLVKTYTNKSDTVLDNCMGSGTTGVACVSNDRNFIGIELDKSYFDIAKSRIEREESEMKRKLF